MNALSLLEQKRLITLWRCLSFSIDCREEASMVTLNLMLVFVTAGVQWGASFGIWSVASAMCWNIWCSRYCKKGGIFLVRRTVQPSINNSLFIEVMRRWYVGINHLRPFKKNTNSKILQSLGVQTNQSMSLAEAIAQVTKTIFLLDQNRKTHIRGSIVVSMLLYFPWFDSYSRCI